MKKLIFVGAVALAGLLAGCSSTPTAVTIQKDEAAAAAAREAAEAKRMARADERAEKYLKRVPDWVSNPPRGDGAFVYAVGSGQSSKFDLSRQKAVLTGEFGLAKQYRQALSGQERMYQRDNGGTSGTQERYTVLIDKLVDRVQLVGHEVIKTETLVVDGGQYQTWVLMKLSFEDMEKILARQRSDAGADAAIDKQFEELDRRLKELRLEQRAEVRAAKPSPSALGLQPPETQDQAKAVGIARAGE